MFAICVESSHKKGMGHFFRMINFSHYLRKINQKFIFFVNNDAKIISIMKKIGVEFEVVDLFDFYGHWENNLIRKYAIKYWINDRLNTNILHTKKIKENNIKLITFDDLGDGAINSDINVSALLWQNNNIKSKKILRGIKYLILNEEIEVYKKKRNSLENILITMGGSDTYGVTVRILELLKKNNIKATIHIGPSFNDKKELEEKITNDYKIISNIPSLIKEFEKYDLAITGGGITPFEANCSGLPCLIVANETFEIDNAKYLESLGSSKFLGFHKNLDINFFSELEKLDIVKMSLNGLNQLNNNGAHLIYNEIKKI